MTGNRRLYLPLVFVFVLTAALWAVIVVRDIHPRLGLDLRGGTSVTFRPVPAPGTQVDEAKLNTTVDIIRNRVNAQGVAESEVNVEGGNIVVALPEVRDPDQVIKAVGTTAQLRFRPVLESVPPSDPKYKQGEFAKVDCAKEQQATDDPNKEVVLCVQDPGQTKPAADALKMRLGPVALGGPDISRASAELRSAGVGWVTALQLSGKGGDKFAKLTGDLARFPPGDPRREIAITLDGVVINHPPVSEQVQAGVGIRGGSAEITGQTEQEAKALAPLISAGALPFDLEVVNRDTVSATLGADSLHAGLVAGAIGLAAVLLYMLVYYRLLGLAVWVGLGLAGALNVGAVLLMGELIGFTLTLAGIAGLIVAIGISADTYIVFFERVKDEARDGRTVRAAVDRGWSRSFHTLVSANTVSLLAAVILYTLAIGPVRGFAFTLGLATFIDFFAAWFFARPAVTLLGRFRPFREGRLGLPGLVRAPAGEAAAARA
ncbi:MAG TPA: protein translocase subunit SecD [Actinomycetes bacterium]|nr:protein translocase subunit SecD [Actinomycetes bacterium]